MGPRPVVGPPLELLVVLLQALSTRAKAPSNAMGASFLRFFISCSPLRDGTDNLWPHGAAMLLATLRRTGPLVTVSPRVYTKSLPRTAACNPLRGRPLGPAPPHAWGLASGCLVGTLLSASGITESSASALPTKSHGQQEGRAVGAADACHIVVPGSGEDRASLVKGT